MKRTFGIVIILSTLFITALSGCNEISSTPQLVSKAEGVFSESLSHDESSEAKEAKEVKTEFYIGETAELDKVQTTLIDVTESTGSEYNQPNEGNVFVLCEFEICNNSDTEIAVSSMLSFEAYCDDYTCSGSFLRCSKKAIKPVRWNCRSWQKVQRCSWI